MLTRNYNLHPVPIKHIPQRTCVACRKVKAKRELIRLVHTPNGNVEIDISGRKSGRGAYLCRLRECWELGFKGDRLGHTLRSHISADDRKQLIEQAKELLKGANQ